MNAELSRLVAGGRHHAAGGRIADGDRQAPQVGIAALFDRCVEGIHVHMHDFARPLAAFVVCHGLASIRTICIAQTWEVRAAFCHPTAFVWARSPSPCAGGSQRRSCQRQTLSPTACAQARSGDDMGTDEFDDRLPAILQFRGQIVHWLPWAHAKNSHSRHRFESVGGILRRALSLNFRAPHAH